MLTQRGTNRFTDISCTMCLRLSQHRELGSIEDSTTGSRADACEKGIKVEEALWNTGNMTNMGERAGGGMGGTMGSMMGGGGGRGVAIQGQS